MISTRNWPANADFDVVVIGASIAGAALVIALKDAGLRIAIVDRTQDFDENKLTWGHDLQPNALLALSKLEMIDAVNSLGARHDVWHAVLNNKASVTFDYGTLRHPFPYAICIRPHLIRNALRDAIRDRTDVEWLVPGEFKSYESRNCLRLINAEYNNKPLRLSTRLLIGADGPLSRVRSAARIDARVRQYRSGWVDTIWRLTDKRIPDGYVYLGPGSYLGIVPTREGEIVTFEQTKARSRAEYERNVGSVHDLYRRYTTLAPVLVDALEPIESWEKVTWTPSVRVRANEWVGDGVALVGDAALTVNPITSQGVCLALQSAVGLATIVREALACKDVSREGLAPYESWYRESCELIQEAGDMMEALSARTNRLSWGLMQRVFINASRTPAFMEYAKGYLAGLHWLVSERPSSSQLLLSALIGSRHSRIFSAGSGWAPPSMSGQGRGSSANESSC